MNLTAKRSELSVGVRILDCDHRVLFDTIGEIQEAAIKDEDRRKTGALLRRLAGFTLTHFELEEEIMAATRYPGLARHRLDHRRVMEQMKALISRHNRRGLVLDRKLDRDSLSILSQLHATHVQDSDLPYGLWLNETGND
jgi:hemerythrin-like metal-binding protein